MVNDRVREGEMYARFKIMVIAEKDLLTRWDYDLQVGLQLQMKWGFGLQLRLQYMSNHQYIPDSLHNLYPSILVRT